MEIKPRERCSVPTGFLHSSSAGIKRLLQFFYVSHQGSDNVWVYCHHVCTEIPEQASLSRFDFPTIIYIPPECERHCRMERWWWMFEDLSELWNISEQSLGKAVKGFKNGTLLSAGLCYQSRGSAVVTSGSVLGSLGCSGLCWKWWEVTLRLSMEVMLLWLWSLIKSGREAVGLLFGRL